MAEKCFSNISSFYYSTAHYKVCLCHLSLAAVLLSSLFVTLSHNVLQAAHLALHIMFQASQINIERKIFLCKRPESRKNIPYVRDEAVYTFGEEREGSSGVQVMRIGITS